MPDGQPPSPPELTTAIRVVFLLQPNFSLLAFTAAADALTTANLVIGYKKFQCHTLSLTDSMVVSDLGILIACDSVCTHADLNSREAISAVLGDINLLVVCGGYRCSLLEDIRVSTLLTTAASNDIALGGLWNGVFALAHANLLTGFGCALHANDHARARRLFPALDIRRDTVVIDRDRWSAAGPNSAFDLMLSLVQRHDSARTLHGIRQILKSDTSTEDAVNNVLQRDKEHTYPRHLKAALQLMRTNLSEPVSKDEVARHINKSPRALERLFRTHLNTSPSRYYLKIRLQRAFELLAQTEQSIAEISAACGFVSSAHFSRAFHHQYGNSPSKLRKAVVHVLDL